ncbi:MAG: hypothetical protein ACRDZX_06925 [Acidimicrobiales bacterium]
MPKFLLLVNYDGGLPETPMPSWNQVDIKAHLAYYDALNHELTASGELMEATTIAAARSMISCSSATWISLGRSIVAPSSRGVG